MELKWKSVYAWTTGICLSIIYISTVCGVQQQPSSSPDTLVLLDNLVLKETHSKFFTSLQEAGYQLAFKLSDDATLALRKYGVWLYKNVIILAPSTDEFGGDFSTETIAEFVDNGGNLLIIGNSNTEDAIKDLTPEFGLEFDDSGAYAIDHINFSPTLDRGKHTTIELKQESVTAPKPIYAGPNSVMLYEGSTLLADPENPLVIDVLVAPSSSYSYNPNNEITQYPHTLGKNAILIGALQARNNARVVISASTEFFSNKFFGSQTSDGKLSGNGEFVRQLIQWNFMKNGVLHLSNITHHKVGEKQPPSSYTIMEDVVYTVTIEEMKNGVWSAYTAKDVQLEFVRIDPFVRVNLTPVSGSNGKYQAKFRIPDVYGVYQFKIHYQRKGYTFLLATTQVSVRPLQHTQYERFIAGAFPYYASSLSMMIGVSIFACVFLPRGKSLVLQLFCNSFF